MRFLKNVVMRKIIFIIALSLSVNGFAQASKKENPNILLKELAENGCKCVDSIRTYNKSKDEIAKEVSECIDKQSSAYQLGSKLMMIDVNHTKARKEKKGANTKIDISINQNKNSEEYKKYYYELEGEMMDNCKSLKEKMASNEKQAKKSFSDNAKAKIFYTKGQDYFNKEKYNEAIESFNKALQEDPDFAFAWDNLGLSYRKLENYDKAMECYEKSLELDPKGLMPLQNIAIVYQYKKEYEKAINAYKKLAEIDAKNPEVFYGIGNVYTMNLKDFENGLVYMCKAYNIYSEQKSPYRIDAEKIINYIYSEMKKQDKTDKFNQILESNHINQK